MPLPLASSGAGGSPRQTIRTSTGDFMIYLVGVGVFFVAVAAVAVVFALITASRQPETPTAAMPDPHLTPHLELELQVTALKRQLAELEDTVERRFASLSTSISRAKRGGGMTQAEAWEHLAEATAAAESEPPPATNGTEAGRRVVIRRRN